MNFPFEQGLLPQQIELSKEQVQGFSAMLTTPKRYPDWMKSDPIGILRYSQNCATQICDFDPKTHTVVDGSIRIIDWSSVPTYPVIVSGLVFGAMAGNVMWPVLEKDVRYKKTADHLKQLLHQIGINVQSSDIGLEPKDDAEKFIAVHTERMERFTACADLVSRSLPQIEPAVRAFESGLDINNTASASSAFRDAVLVGVGAAALHFDFIRMEEQLSTPSAIDDFLGKVFE